MSCVIFIGIKISPNTQESDFRDLQDIGTWTDKATSFFSRDGTMARPS